MAGYGKQVGKLSLRVLPDASKFRRDIDVLIERIERTKQVKLPVVADTQKARLELQRFHEKWNGENIRMGLEVGTARVREQLAVLTRPRTVTIKADADKMSFAKVAAGINSLTARLGGLRVAQSVFDEFREKITNLDQSTGKISRVGLALANLTSVLTNSIGAIVTTSADILSIANIGFVLPAAFAGAATGATALVLALKDMSTVLADLGPAFTAIQPLVSEAFWSQAEGPIRNLATTYLPALTTGMTAVGNAIGNQMGVMADAFNNALGNGVFEGFFNTLVETINIATGAVAPLVQAFVKMGEVGAGYLPDFAKWMTDVSTAFNNWVQQAAASGEMNRLIEAGVQAVKDLASAAGGIAGIFSAINTAATAAGGTGLSGFAAAMQAASNILNSPEVQGALTTIFAGAGVGLAQIGSGLVDFGNTLVALAPTIATILSLAGEALGTLISGIAEALNQPAVKEGFTALFVGILEGVQGIVPALPVLFGLFGQLAGIVGSLASQFGSLLGALKTTFAPVLEAVLAAVSPLIPVIGGALVSAVGALSGPMQGLADFINQNQAALTGLLGAAIVIAPAIMVGVKAFQAFQTVMGVVKAAQAGFVAASYGMQAASYASGAAAKVGALAFKAWGVATKVWQGITMAAAGAQRALNLAIAANPIGAIVTAIIIVVTALIYFFTQTKLGKQIWAEFVRFLGECWDNIVAGWNAIVDGFSQGWQQIQAFFQGVIDWVKSLFGIHSPSKVFQDIGMYIVEGFVQGFQNLLALVAAIWQPIADFFVNLWNGVVAVGQALWTAYVAVLTAIWTGIVSVVTTVFGAIGAFFSALWQGILTVASTVWNAIVSVISAVITGLQGIILAVIGAIRGGWSNWLTGMQSIASAVWNAIVSVITAVINGVRSVILSVVNAIAGAWQAWLSGLQSTASAIWNAIRSVVQAAINGVSSVINSVLNGIRSMWSAGWNALSSVVNSVWSAIKSAVSGAVSAVSSTVSQIATVISGIRDRVMGAIGNAGSWLLESGRKIVQGLIDGITGMIGRAKDAISGVMGAIRNFLPFSPAKEGPFSGKGWTPHSGKALVDGLAEGMRSRISNVRSAALAMTEAASTTATVGLEATGDSLDAAYAARVSAGTPDYITIQGGVGYDPQSIANEIAFKKRQAALAAGLGMVPVR